MTRVQLTDDRFRQWRDAGVFEALLKGLIAEAAKRGKADLSLVSIDSTTARVHHDAAGSGRGHRHRAEEAVGAGEGKRGVHGLWFVAADQDRSLPRFLVDDRESPLAR